MIDPFIPWANKGFHILWRAAFVRQRDLHLGIHRQFMGIAVSVDGRDKLVKDNLQVGLQLASRTVAYQNRRATETAKSRSGSQEVTFGPLQPINVCSWLCYLKCWLLPKKIIYYLKTLFRASVISQSAGRVFAMRL